nr:uncharacterized protein LOC127348764 [Lolium perenne]
MATLRNTGVLCLVALSVMVAVLPSEGEVFCLPPTPVYCDMELCRQRCGDRQGPMCKALPLDQYACCCSELKTCYPGGTLPGCTRDRCMRMFCPGNINAHCNGNDFCCCPFRK